MMQRSETVQKSIRLPVEMVDYIESNQGKNFNSKLVNILNESQRGEAKRAAQLAEYNEMLNERRKDLTELNEKLRDANLILNTLQQFFSVGQRVAKKAEKDEAAQQ